MISKIKSILALVGIVLICILMFILGRKSVGEVETTTITRVDTVRVEVPTPYKVEVVRKVSVPIYVPTPADTVVIARVDSILVEVPIEVERREYKSEEYRAIVSGAKVGELRPTLESMEMYNKREKVVVQPKAPLFRPYVSANIGKEIVGVGGGVSIKDRVDIGAKYMRVGDSNALMVEFGCRFNIKDR